MEPETLNLSDSFHQAMLDKYAVVLRCVPNTANLAQVIKKISDTRKDLQISTFSPQEYKNIFRLMFAFVPSITDFPTDTQLELIVKTFRHIAAQNHRTDGQLDTDDLWALCVMYNILCYQADSRLYLKKFKNWKG